MCRIAVRGERISPTADKLGGTIPSASIGEPVASVALSAPKWTAATSTIPAYCSVDNSMVTEKEE
jgi:hypothetical protein